MILGNHQDYKNAESGNFEYSNIRIIFRTHEELITGYLIHLRILSPAPVIVRFSRKYMFTNTLTRLGYLCRGYNYSY